MAEIPRLSLAKIGLGHFLDKFPLAVATNGVGKGEFAKSLGYDLIHNKDVLRIGAVGEEEFDGSFRFGFEVSGHPLEYDNLTRVNYATQVAANKARAVKEAIKSESFDSETLQMLSNYPMLMLIDTVRLVQLLDENGKVVSEHAYNKSEHASDRISLARITSEGALNGRFLLGNQAGVALLDTATGEIGGIGVYSRLGIAVTGVDPRTVLADSKIPGGADMDAVIDQLTDGKDYGGLAMTSYGLLVVGEERNGSMGYGGTFSIENELTEKDRRLFKAMSLGLLALAP